ncbi:hypothetical protein ACW14X_19395 [Nocardioides sp. YJ-D4]
MSKPDPTWYGTVLRSYAAWIGAVLLATAAGWLPLWIWTLDVHGWDGIESLWWAIFAFVTVGVGSGLVLTRLAGLPGVSGLATLCVIVLAYLAFGAYPPLAWTLLAAAPAVGAGIAMT